MLLGDITLIEYSPVNGKTSFFLQSGVTGFYASEEELMNIYGLLNYYYNMDSVNNTVISVK